MFKPSSVVHTLRKIPILQCLPTVWFVGILPLACFPKLDDKTFGLEEEEDMFLPMEIDSLHSSAARPLNGVGGSPGSLQLRWQY